jgi:hypothetical protein
MVQESNILRFPMNPRRAATSGMEGISPVLIAECQIMERIRLRRIADIAYDGLLNDREHASLATIAALLSMENIA